jgi:hypothetical protein
MTSTEVLYQSQCELPFYFLKVAMENNRENYFFGPKKALLSSLALLVLKLPIWPEIQLCFFIWPFHPFY